MRRTLIPQCPAPFPYLLVSLKSGLFWQRARGWKGAGGIHRRPGGVGNAAGSGASAACTMFPISVPEGYVLFGYCSAQGCSGMACLLKRERQEDTQQCRGVELGGLWGAFRPKPCHDYVDTSIKEEQLNSSSPKDARLRGAGTAFKRKGA